MYRVVLVKDATKVPDSLETVERFADMQAAQKCRDRLMAKCPDEIYAVHDDNAAAPHEETIARHQRLAGSHQEQFETLSANIRLLARIKADLLDLNIAMGSSCKVVDNGLEDWMCRQAHYHRKLQVRYQKHADNAIASGEYQRAKRFQAHFQQEDRQEERERQDTLALVEGMLP
jgi:hypothetical protein